MLITMPPLASPSLDGSVRCVARLDLRRIVALAAVYVIWGSTYYAMRVAVHGLPAMGMGAARFLVAGAILLALARLGGARWPTARQWLASLPIGVLFFVGGNGLVAVAEQTLDSGLAAVVCATMPLWAALGASATGERPSRREWLGLGLGFAGVVVLVGDASTGGDPLHLALLVLAPISWAAGTILARRRPLPAGPTAAALPMLTGGLAMLAVAAARGEQLPASAPADAWIALAYLTVFGSLIAFSAYAWLLRHTRPAVATSYAYVNPVIAVLIGAALGGEVLGAGTLAASLLIVAAVALVVTHRRRS
jgi:drug/metabolite transporter (DMT)-like permease